MVDINSQYKPIDLTKSRSVPVNLKTNIRVYSVIDKEYHEYFTEFTYDADDTEYMHTGELTAPYSNDLMGYWAPISTECIIYGSNDNNEKIIFVGRSRGIKQQGYSCVVSLQGFGWKFQEVISAELAQELTGLSCDVVLEIILELLKIPSYTMDEKTKFFLQQYALNDNGEVVKGTEKAERIPDLLDRIGSYSPLMNKQTISEKLKESKSGNIKDINYTLQYTSPTPVMKKLQQSSTADSTVVAQNNTNTDTGTASSTTVAPNVGLTDKCPSIKFDKNDDRVKIDAALCTISKYVTGKLNNTNTSDNQALTNAINRIKWFHDKYGKKAYTGSSGVQAWLNTILRGSKYDRNAQKSYLKKQGLPWY